MKPTEGGQRYRSTLSLHADILFWNCFSRIHSTYPTADLEVDNCTGLHSVRHHSRQALGRVMCPSQKSLSDNTHYSQVPDIHVTSGIRNRNPSKRVTTNPRLKPLGLWDRHSGMLSFPATALDRPLVFQEVEAPEFLDNRHMKVVRLSIPTHRPSLPPGRIPGTHFC